MNFDITHEGRTTLSVDHAGALALGYPLASVGAALKAQARKAVAREAENYRAKLATTSAGKLGAYRVKEDIARDPSAASADELALIDREAVARGTDRAGLLALILAKATAYRRLALLVEAIEAEANAAINAIPDDAAAIEAQITNTLGAAKAQSEPAFEEALTLIKGGSHA